MRLTEIVRVDVKGRITIPMVIREALNIVEGMYLIISADTEKKEIILSPIMSPEAEIYELYIELEDVPGALAQVSEFLAENNVDQISTHCTSVKRGELASCGIIIDVSRAKISVDELKDKLAMLEPVRMVNLRPLKRELGKT